MRHGITGSYPKRKSKKKTKKMVEDIEEKCWKKKIRK
jgi:hypothetical protein